MGGNIKDAVVDGFEKAVDYIKSLPGRAKEWGKDFIQGIVDGIKGMISKLKNAVKDVAGTIASHLHFPCRMRDRSPARLSGCRI